MNPTTAGIGLGWLADQLLGDPRRHHPVAGFGRMASALERKTYADARANGVAHVALLVGGAAGLGLLLDRVTRRHPIVRTLVTATATWAVLGGRTLLREVDTLQPQLIDEDLDAARTQIRHLVGRDPSDLDLDDLARACVESVAENTSDAVVAPLFWGAVAGLPGLLGYRAVNTLDAMIGHRTERYTRFGWAAARLDDLANAAPARLAAGLTAVAAPVIDGSPLDVIRTVAEDADQHPSPNAGVAEAAFAGALNVQLGGTNSYHGETEDRGHLGSGPAVTVADIPRARRLAWYVMAGGLAAAMAIRTMTRRSRRSAARATHPDRGVRQLAE